MPPLAVQAQNRNGEWYDLFPRLTSNDRPGSLSDNKPDGSRDVYVFGCLPTGGSRIIKLRKGIDVEIGSQLRAFSSLEEGDVIATLDKGQSHELEITPPRSRGTLKIRFMHFE